MWLEVIVIVVFVVVFLLVVAIFYGSKCWQADTRELHARMNAASVPIETTSYDPHELDELPAPVQRYFRTVLKEGQPLVAAVGIEHTGSFNMGETGEQWKPFRSTQRVIVQRPGFAWDARIRMAPGMTVHVRDAYVAGEGVLTAKLFGLLTVMKQPSTSELAHGELLRFFAEAAWYPTALLPSQGVAWEAIDDRRASATFLDGPMSVKLMFQFDAQGLICSVRSEGRHREVGGELIATPWQGRFWGYEARDGMLVPLNGEVEWLLAEGAKPYWRGQIQRIQYEMSHR
jgi:hypothetical protein